MVEKRYSWENGVKLEEHTRRKHKVLREYLIRYLTVRCSFPQQTKFRLAIIEGFAGGGRYDCGSPGSPLIFLEELRAAAERFNLKRQAESMAPLDIECLMILNDEDPGTVGILKRNVEPVIATVLSEVPKLHLRVAYFAKPFEALYPEIKALLIQSSYQNVLFNLDQYGHSDVDAATIGDISTSFNSAEVFYTFNISSLLAYLPKRNPTLLERHLSVFGVTPTDLSALKAR
jgi:three-Cys-motif partner protein